jgi:uroporphyrinogen decarboxylase
MYKFLNAIRGVNLESPPVFMMRQAGRYHSHYRKIKEQHTFEEICKNPKIAAEVALAPVQEFGFDAGILFSDILFLLETLGYNVVFNPAPEITQGVVKPIDAMSFQADAIIETKKLFGNAPLIGFVGGLATIHHFLIKSGNFRKNHEKIQDFVSEIYALYLQNIMMQINAGASCIAIFDSKSHADINYWQTVQNVINDLRLQTQIPIIYYSNLDEHLRLTNINCFGITSGYNIINIMRNNSDKTFYGNFNEKILTEKPDICRKMIDEYLENILKNTTQEMRTKWIASLGHGVLKESFEENVKYFVQSVRRIFS